jgi:pescadillo protein
MGRKIKKGTKGEVTKYCTRSQALKKLQLKLSEFRRLCILKGIFPKEPKKKFKGINKTYYFLKDIKYLANEQLLRKFREITVWDKKIKHAKNRNEEFNMQKLIENKPTYTIDHILRERYPRFLDALNDLDDALCLVTLFANLPKHELINLNTDTIALCKRLVREFYFYVSTAKILKKTFISIKGIYLSAEIMGNEIVWLNPFNYPQKLTFEVDYSIMLSFLELYTSLLKFVNFKLFKDIGLEYPPRLEFVDQPFFGLDSLSIKNVQNQVESKTAEEKETVAKELNCESKEMQNIYKQDDESKALKNLFKTCVFFISREIPKEIFAMVILSSGGLYGDDSENSSFQYNDKRITHYIVDRKPEFVELVPNKEFVQPQWVFDSVNQRKLLPVSEYAPGKTLPPHISPFFDYDKNEYTPKIVKNIPEEKATTTFLPQVTVDSEEEKEGDLNEMLISNKKKNILKKIRLERTKKFKQPKIKKSE